MAEQMTGYPAKADEVFAESFQEQLTEWFGSQNKWECRMDAGKMSMTVGRSKLRQGQRRSRQNQDLHWSLIIHMYTRSF